VPPLLSSVSGVCTPGQHSHSSADQAVCTTVRQRHPSIFIGCVGDSEMRLHGVIVQACSHHVVGIHRLQRCVQRPIHGSSLRTNILEFELVFGAFIWFASFVIANWLSLLLDYGIHQSSQINRCDEPRRYVNGVWHVSSTSAQNCTPQTFISWAFI
jgi:hypothetical protein